MSNISRLVRQPSWDSSVPLLDRLEASLTPLSVSGIPAGLTECQQIRVVSVLISSPNTHFCPIGIGRPSVPPSLPCPTPPEDASWLRRQRPHIWGSHQAARLIARPWKIHNGESCERSSDPHRGGWKTEPGNSGKGIQPFPRQPGVLEYSDSSVQPRTNSLPHMGSCYFPVIILSAESPEYWLKWEECAPPPPPSQSQHCPHASTPCLFSIVFSTNQKHWSFSRKEAAGAALVHVRVHVAI